jgi:integrase
MSHHKASDQAIVRLGGRDFYLGPWGSKTARNEYDRLIAEWLVGGRRAPKASTDGLTITELLAAFWDHAEVYYRHPDGTPSSEIHCLRDALKILRRLYGHTPAGEFGPLALKAVREAMIEARWGRKNINRRIGRIKRVFKWATENELIPLSIFHGLQAVAGLKAGRSGARETEAVKPVPEARVLEVLPHVSRQVAAMIQLQMITGMRPGEVVTMRGIDIDMTEKLWLYRPARHKTQYLDHDRFVILGPRAQEILRPFLKTDLNAHLFSPADAEAERRQKQHEHRKTPLSCGNKPGTNIKRKPKKQPQLRYRVNSYAHAIKYACEKLYPLPQHLRRKVIENGKLEARDTWRKGQMPEQKAEIKAWRADHSWHPHQLRHSAATNLRKTFGLEPAQVILGHKTLTVTQVYAEKNIETAMRIMAEVG